MFNFNISMFREKKRGTIFRKIKFPFVCDFRNIIVKKVQALSHYAQPKVYTVPRLIQWDRNRRIVAPQNQIKCVYFYTHFFNRKRKWYSETDNPLDRKKLFFHRCNLLIVVYWKILSFIKYILHKIIDFFLFMSVKL